MYPSADAIFDILVERAGAHEDRHEEFLHVWPDCREFRFEGVLGFGGKVWYGGENNPPRVSCYREDENEERLTVIADTNRTLMDLWLASADGDSSGLGRATPGALRSFADSATSESLTVIRHYLRDAAEQIESAPRDIVYRWRSDNVLKARLAQAIRGGCPEIFEGIYEDFPALIVDSVFDVLDAEVRKGI